MAAGNDFFTADVNNPPMRVAGPPFDTATALVAGTAADTRDLVYRRSRHRSGALDRDGARIDSSITVSYGMRANEEALRLAVQNIAVFAAVTYSPGDPQADASYAALKQRVGDRPRHARPASRRSRTSRPNWPARRPR